MSIVQLERHKCDQCGKEVDSEYGGRPNGWIEISVTEWSGHRGESLISKEVCSICCAEICLGTLHKLPIRKRKAKMICHPI